MKLSNKLPLSKTTLNFAFKRKIDIINAPVDSKLWVFVTGESEPSLFLLSNKDGSFSFAGNVDLPQEVKEELPAHIRDEKHLREVLDFISKEVECAGV